MRKNNDQRRPYSIRVSTPEIREIAFKDMKECKVKASIIRIAKHIREYPKEIIIPLELISTNY